MALKDYTPLSGSFEVSLKASVCSDLPSAKLVALDMRRRLATFSDAEVVFTSSPEVPDPPAPPAPVVDVSEEPVAVATGAGDAPTTDETN